jgi:hypothetical protein
MAPNDDFELDSKLSEPPSDMDLALAAGLESDDNESLYDASDSLSFASSSF